MLRLAEQSDLVVDNLRGGVMERLGLTYEAFSRVNNHHRPLGMSGPGWSGPAGEYAGWRRLLT